MNNHHDWKATHCFGLLFLLTAVATWRFVQQVPLPAVLAQNPQAEIECTAYCSNLRPGVSYIEVRWRIAAQPMTDANLRTQVSSQKLDVTVYADGFDKSLYTRLDALRPKAQFRSMPAPGPAPRSAPGDSPAGTGRRSGPLPGLGKLRLSDVGTRETRPAAEAMRLLDQSTTPATTPTGPEWVVVRLEGVEPGMEYTFRVPGAQATATCAAVVCPVDSPRRPSTKPKVAQPRPGF